MAGRMIRTGLALGLCTTVLAGCSSIGGFTGAAAGITTGAATSNPAVGIAVGVAVQAATDAAIARYFRGQATAEQNLMAGYAGAMAVGDTRAWGIRHPLSFSPVQGQLTVLREIDNALTSCKEVAFSVVEGKGEKQTTQWFITQTCLNSAGQWRWAAAEPATARWGVLQ